MIENKIVLYGIFYLPTGELIFSQTFTKRGFADNRLKELIESVTNGTLNGDEYLHAEVREIKVTMGAE